MMRRRYSTGPIVLLVLTPLLAAPSAAAEPQPPDTQPGGETLRSAEATVDSMVLPVGFHVTVFAAEPHVRQPIALSTDARGRLWVAENYTYAEREVNFAADLRDRIIILADVNGDGQFDRRTVFWDQARKLTSIEVGFGGVWALCAPQLLFIPDRDGDDVPDGPPVVVLDGWDDGPVRHNIVNGLKWGPDGWLYGRHGIQATSLVGAPGTPPEERVRLNCSIWRYHPTRGVFEVVTHGTTNSWGFDYDDHGQMFFINTVIGHLWHVVDGARYKRMYGADFNPHAYELIDQCADHYHFDTGERWSAAKSRISDETSRAGGGHAHCGLMIYLADNWPERYRNTLFTVNLHGLRVNNDRIQRRGAGYVGTHQPDFLKVEDPWFRGLEMIYGPDGGVYLADWADIGECHENDGVHRSSGRIYKIMYGWPAPAGPLNLEQFEDRDLVMMQLSANDWFVRHARRILHQRAAAGHELPLARQLLEGMFRQQADVTRKLRAMWCLYAIGAADEAWLIDALAHPEEHVRVWAVRLLCDQGPPSPRAQAALVELAGRESSGLVHLFLASALGRLSPLERWPLAEVLAAQSQWADDPMFPLLLWYGIEPAVPHDVQRAVRLIETAPISPLRRFVARRLTAELDQSPAGAEALVGLLRRTDDRAVIVDVVAGMRDALRGWRRAPAPPGWNEAAALLADHGDPSVIAAVREISIVFGDGRALDQLRSIVVDETLDAPTRRNALRTLVDARADNLLPLLRKGVADRVLAVEAVRGLAAHDDVDSARLILTHYDRLGPEGRAEALTTLVTRPQYAALLLSAVADGRLRRDDVTAVHARAILALGDAALAQRLSEVWGNLRATPDEKKQLIDRYKRQLGPAQLAGADLGRGRLLFNKTCAACHQLYGQGQPVGPDLTGSNRYNLDYLLENLVDPSAVVGVDFRMSMLALADGRVLGGVVTEQSPRTLTVQTPTERITIDRADIDQIEPTSLSLMPDGLLEPLAPEQVRDLVAYLTARSQVPLPPEETGETGRQAAAPKSQAGQ